MPADQPPLRYAIYTRQSVARPADFSSCDAQFDTCQAHIRTKAEPHQWIGQRFDDPGCSGATLDRPALTQLRAQIAAGRLDRIYVTAMDRLSRRVSDLVAVMQEIEEAGISLHLAQEHLPLHDASGRLVRHLLASFAQFEREMIASRISDTRASLIARGKRLAGLMPLGYQTDPQSKQLIIVPSEARRVRLIFKRAAAGQTPSLIAARINHLKWRTKTWIANRSGKTRGGGKWTARQIIYLLRNPVYLGQFRSKTGTRRGSHEPIVDQSLFEQVQAILVSRRTVTNVKRRHWSFPLRQKIICPGCGRPLSTQIISKGTRICRVNYLYYCCRSSAGGRPPCRDKQYPAGEVERLVSRKLESPDLWLGLLPPHQADQAPLLSAAWASLGSHFQRDLVGQMVERVEFRRKHSEMRITFSDRCREAILAQYPGILPNTVNPPVSDEADSF